jgi:hypothetical protein
MVWHLTREFRNWEEIASVAPERKRRVYRIAKLRLNCRAKRLCKRPTLKMLRRNVGAQMEADSAPLELIAPRNSNCIVP